MMNNDYAIDTIYALSSASGKAGVSIIRVSGPLAWKSLDILTPDQSLPKARTTKLMTLVNPSSKKASNVEIIDKAMIVGFKSPASFTGEDVMEYHCHGSSAVIEEILDVLSQIDGHRMADYGEFTRRAFENGKMDLTAAEAVADLIDAETKAQKEQALHQMGGALSSLYNGWAEALTKSLAYIEAIIDFPDEDVPDSETEKAFPAIQKLSNEISLHLNDGRKGERLRNGLQIAIIGAPNAGKSSLVNMLAQRDIAIVSEQAGTTRDIIEAHLNLNGYPVIISDTAGLRPDQIGNEGQEAIESEGIKRALQRAEEADLRILMFDGSVEKLDQNTLDLVNEDSIIVINKIDLTSKDHIQLPSGSKEPMFISIETGEGIEEFVQELAQTVKKLMNVSRETPNLTRQRHRQQLEQCLEYLDLSMQQSSPELIAQELRFAINALGKITGRIDVEDLLDVIFKDFCIGK